MTTEHAVERDWILHVDLDQFLAAVEIARRPELRGLPVVVGGEGDPTRRAVVATASYEAREFGVHSGIPLRLAKKRCPDAVFLPTDPDTYNEVSARVMTSLRGLAVVQVIGWDEASLAVRTADPEAFAVEVRHTVDAATGLSCSVGIGDNKLRAKIATRFGKPAGIFRLTEQNWKPVMDERPVDDLWGIGRKTAKKLIELGIHTVGELAAAEPEPLAARFGPTMGPWLRVLAHGYGDAEVVSTPHIARSHSRETTFQQNIGDRAELDEQVVLLARRVAADVLTDGRAAARVAVKVRFAPFFTQTRSMTLPEPTREAADIERAALRVLDRFEHGRPVRLLGVRAEFVADTSGKPADGNDNR